VTRPVPLARLERLQEIQSRVSAAVGAGLGAVLSAVPEPDAAGKTSAELWLYGVVGGYWFGFSDKTVADQLRGLSVDHITVRLNSPGGDSIQGIAIGNLLRNHKATVTVVVDGLAASAASIIAIAGDEVVMSPGSQMMIHDPWFFTMGNAKELRQDADFLDKQGANMAGVYALEAGGTAETWRAVMTAEPDGTWYTADEAVAAKLADRVGTVVAVGAAPEPPPVDLEDDEHRGLRASRLGPRGPHHPCRPCRVERPRRGRPQDPRGRPARVCNTDSEGGARRVH
jgi:ATP-dependent protease ClpP protease subunit